MLIDTPGMRELGVLHPGDAADRTFEDIHDLSVGCRYADCTHTREPGCAVLAAVASGGLSEQHYQSYLKLRKETSHYETSHADRRKKERAFGRFLKSAKKQMKDRRPRG